MSAAIDAGMMNMAGNDTPTLPRAVMPLLVTAAALITALFAGRAVQPALNRPLTALRVDGALTHLSPTQIAVAAAVPARTHIFDADLSGLRTRIEALPWVGRVRVSRVWPDTLDIRVWERVPSARWGEQQLLDTAGAAFAPPARDLQPAPMQALPQLSGPVGREVEVMAAYHGLNAALQSSEFAPAGLSLDARGEWRMTTARGIELRFGDGDPLAHVPLLLGTVRRTLAPYLEQIEYIDLRYTNGFSVGWVSGGACDAPRRAAANDRPRMAGPGCKESTAIAPEMAAANVKNVVDCDAPRRAAANDRPGTAAPGCSEGSIVSPGTAAVGSKVAPPPSPAPPKTAAPAKPANTQSAPSIPSQPAATTPKTKTSVVAPAAAKEGKK